VYRSLPTKATLNPPVSCNGGAKTSPLLHDLGITAVGLWETCNPVRARLPPHGDSGSHLLFQSLIFNSNNVMCIIMRPMKERNILTPRIYTPSTASISSLFFFKSSNSYTHFFLISLSTSPSISQILVLFSTFPCFLLLQSF